MGVEEELSGFSELLNCTVKKKHDKSCVMLLQTLGNKRHYFVYYKNLALYEAWDEAKESAQDPVVQGASCHEELH